MEQTVSAETKPFSIEITNDTAIASHAPHRATFSGDIRDPVVVDFAMSDGKRLRSRVYGLSYFDSASGRSVLVADTQPCVGEVLPDSRVLYRNAFSNLQASVLYTYREQHFEQDIIFHQRPPSPSDFDLNPETTFMEVITEFIDPPAFQSKQQAVELRGAGQKPAIMAMDVHLDFGLMSIGSGFAFKAGFAQERFPVAKAWLVSGNRFFLIEAIDYTTLRKQMENMGMAQFSPALIQQRIRETAMNDSQHRYVPERRFEPASDLKPIRLASAIDPHMDGFVLDYVISNNIPTAGLKLWVKADSGLTLSGTNVSAWADLSGNTNHFSQTNSGYQPYSVTNVLNGKPVVRFDGTSDFMDSVLTIPSNTMPSVTIYTVERMREIPDEGDYRSVWGTDGAVGYWQRGRGLRGEELEVQMGFWDEEDWSQNSWLPGILINTNSAKIIGVGFTPTDTFLFINGTNYNAGKPNIGEGSEPFRLGAGHNYGGGAHQHAKVDLAEVIIYDRELTGAERAQLENALNARYNIFTNPLAAPVIVPPGGDYNSAISVTINGSIAGSTLQFSTNGTNWSNYSGAITITNTTDLMARAIKSGFPSSAIVIHHYQFGLATNLAIPTNGLKLHLQAATGVEFDGDYISKWKDISGNSNDVNQLTLAYMPLYVTNVHNGNPIIRFDGTSDFMDSLLTIPSNTMPSVTIYTVERMREAPGSSDYRSVWSTDGTTGYWQRGRGFHGTNHEIQVGYWHPSDWSQNAWQPGVPIVTNSLKIVGISYSPTNTYLFIDGTNYNAGKQNIGAGSQPFRIGAGQTGGGNVYQHAKADLAEVIIYDRELSPSERAQIEYALQARYVITNLSMVDTDGDGVNDWLELSQGRDPTKGATNDTGNQINLNVFRNLR